MGLKKRKRKRQQALKLIEREDLAWREEERRSKMSLKKKKRKRRRQRALKSGNSDLREEGRGL